MTKLEPHHGFGGRTVIALAEEEVERSMDGRKTRCEVIGGELKEPLGAGEDFLASRKALFDCVGGCEKRACDLANAEPAQHLEDERDLHVFVKPRVAA